LEKLGTRRGNAIEVIVWFDQVADSSYRNIPGGKSLHARYISGYFNIGN
jgi:hypothetical protein